MNVTNRAILLVNRHPAQTSETQNIRNSVRNRHPKLRKLSYCWARRETLIKQPHSSMNGHCVPLGRTSTDRQIHGSLRASPSEYATDVERTKSLVRISSLNLFSKSPTQRNDNWSVSLVSLRILRTKLRGSTGEFKEVEIPADFTVEHSDFVDL